MRKKSPTQAGLFNLRVLTGLALCLFGVVLSLFAGGVLTGSSRTTGQQQAKPGTQKPDVVAMVSPVVQGKDLRDLPYIPARDEHEEHFHTRYLRENPNAIRGVSDPFLPLMRSSPSVSMPSPLQTFAGMSQSDACGTCLPPDSNGDVGSNNYVESVNSSIRIHDKQGNVLSGPTTYNSFFSALGSERFRFFQISRQRPLLPVHRRVEDQQPRFRWLVSLRPAS